MTSTEFETFLQRYEQDIFSFCRYLTMDEDKADDLYQDTVLQAFAKIDSIDITHNPKSFLFSIAVRKWKNARRKAGRRNEIAPTILFGDYIEGLAGSDDPDHHMQRTLLRTCLQTAFAGMDDRFRLPLLLFYFDDCDVAFIARVCGIPQGTVKSRLYKGRRLLKEALKKEGFADES